MSENAVLLILLVSSGVITVALIIWLVRKLRPASKSPQPLWRCRPHFRMPSAEAAFVAGGAPLEPDQELLDPSRPNLGALDCEGLRREFHARLIELANDFDSLDHLAGPMGGSELQDDCQRVRDLARALARESKPAAV